MRTRKAENRGLPTRWRKVRGAYYYQVPPGQEAQWDGKQTFPLGKTLPEAYKAWAKRLESLNNEASTIGQLLDRYGLEVLPAKSPKTRHNQVKYLAKLRPVFGKMPLAGLVPQDIYRYHRLRGEKPTARKEIAVLSHAYTKAVEWGFIDKHPFKGQIRLTGEAPRDRYIEDWEILECLALPPLRLKRDATKAIQAYIKIKLLTGLRQRDLLTLNIGQQMKADGIYITPSKTRHQGGRPIIIEWTEALRQAVEEAKAARPVHISPYLFCNRWGHSYVNLETGLASGWASLWQRFMKRALKETKLERSFTEHDIRGKTGSDADTLEHAQRLLAHADSRMTERTYRRKPTRVMPLK